jgi:hypothetical protein
MEPKLYLDSKIKLRSILYKKEFNLNLALVIKIIIIFIILRTVKLYSRVLMRVKKVKIKSEKAKIILSFQSKIKCISK